MIKKEAILIVGDPSDTLDRLESFLAEQGYNVSSCSTLAVARDVVRSGEFRLIITAYNLTDGLGEQLTDYGIPVIGLALDESGEQEDGAPSHTPFTLQLVRPIRLTELLDAVQQVLADPSRA